MRLKFCAAAADSNGMRKNVSTPRSARPWLPAGVHRSRSRGFTLIELMIAVAVVGILMALALPSYTEHVRRSHRSEAQAYLMAVANRQHQFLIDTRAFAALANVGVAVPAAVSNHYTVTLELEAGPPPGFSVVATPKGSQASERCGVLSIDQTGTKGADKTGCW